MPVHPKLFDLLKLDNEGQLPKVYRITSGGLTLMEFKANDQLQVGALCLKRSNIISTGLIVGESAECDIWTQFFQDVIDGVQLPYNNQFSLLSADSRNTYVLVPDAVDLNFLNTAPFTWSLWIKSTNGGAVIYVEKTDGNRGYTIEKDGSDRLLFEMRGAGTGDRIRLRVDIPTVPFNVGDWNNIICTTDGSSTAAGTQMYINGQVQAKNVLNDTLVTTLVNVGSLAFCSNSVGGVANLDGFIDEPILFNVNFNAAEALELYNSGFAMDIANSHSRGADIISWWDCNDKPSFPVLTDVFGANNGNMNNFVSGDFTTEIPAG